MAIKRLSILGSTGSIGTNTLDVVRRFRDRFRILVLAAGKNVKLLANQIREFSPLQVSVPGEKEKIALQKELGHSNISILTGQDGLKKMASFPDADLVMIAISGSSGLLPAYWAIKSGHNVALANKESLVMAGQIITALAKDKGVKILPIDSEHSAISNCLAGRKKEDVSRIILTASGGPFRDYTLEQMKGITPEQALAHPVWQMGEKITIDSSTMMNKGLEIIEARWLFNLPASSINVLVHPESIIHSMVEYRDGSIISLLSVPDMRLPIMNALGFPDMLPCEGFELDLVKTGKLTFLSPDEKKFPTLALGYWAARVKGTLPAVLNAADEVCVSYFLEGKIAFLDIMKYVEKIMSKHVVCGNPDYTEIIAADNWAREEAKRFCQR